MSYGYLLHSVHSKSESSVYWKIIKSQPESRGLFYLAGMLRTPILGGSISLAQENCPKEAEGGVSLQQGLQQREQAVWTSKIIAR